MRFLDDFQGVHCNFFPIAPSAAFMRMAGFAFHYVDSDSAILSFIICDVLGMWFS
jgi:hypothetical protein